MVDFSKLNTPAAIKNAKDAGGKDIFDNSEKLIFLDTRLGSDVAKHRGLAELLYKVKQAETTFQEEHPFHDWIEKQHKDKNTLSYQILNARDERVDVALERLRTFFKVPGQKPKNKKEIEEEIKTLEAEQRGKQKLAADKATLRRSFVNEKTKKLGEKSVIQANLQRKSNLLKLLKWDGVTNSITDETINLPDGTTPKLSAVTLNCTTDKSVSNYGGNNLFSSSPPYYADATTLKKILDDARTHLNNIYTHKLTVPVNYYKTSTDGNHYNDRTHNCKHNISCSQKDFGYCFLGVLREIGAERLKKVVDEAVSSTAERNKLKKYAEEIVKYIHQVEIFMGEIGYNVYSPSHTAEGYVQKHDKWQKTLLEAKLDEYPYKEVPNWKIIFEFMSKVLPKNSSANYLSNPSHGTYLSPTKTGATGWDNVYLGGFAHDNPDKVKYRGMAAYAADHPNSIVAKQIEPYELKNDLSLKSLVNLWWSVFSDENGNPFFNPLTYQWTKTETTVVEADIRQLQEELRYAKTMRELVKALGLTSTIDELDYAFLDIASRFSKSGWLGTTGRSKLLDKFLERRGDKQSVIRAVAENRVWKDIGPHNQVDWRALQTEVERENSNLSFVQSEIDRIDKKISELSEEESSINIETEVIKNKIKDLQLLLDDFDNPVDEQIKKFDNAYKVKDSQGGKWTVAQASNLISRLANIKKTLITTNRGNEYKSKGFETKQTEIEALLKTVDTPNNVIYIYERLGKTDTERIKQFLLENEDERPNLTLEDVKKAYEEIEKKFKLDDGEVNTLKLIKEAIKDPTKYKDKIPTDLTVDKLNTLFGTTGISASDIHESVWKGLTNFNTEANVKALVENYVPNATGHTGLQEHLKHEDWGKSDKWGGERIEGTDWWEKLVKKGPKFMIGAIRHYEWENGKGIFADATKKAAVKTDMETANDDEKAKELGVTIEKKWDTNKASHVAHFLYLQAVGKTGKELIKGSKPIETPEKKDDENGKGGFLNHLKNNWVWYAAGGLLLVVGIGLVIYFWANIKGLFGTSEGGETEEDKENE